MKRFFCAVLAFLSLALTGCGAAVSHPAGGGKLRVVCTLFPYYDFVRQIGGDDVDDVLLLSPGREAHSFEPTPMDIITIREADLFIYNGGEGEVWVEDVLSAGGPAGDTVRMMDFVSPYQEEYTEGMQLERGGEEKSDEIEYDEHIWTSPVNAAILSQAVCQALQKADPAHSDDYQANLEAYLARLSELDSAFRQVVAQGHRETLVFGDRFPLLYFCKTYGLNYRAAFHGCSSDTEPSLATLKYLIDKVKTDHIPVVYTIDLSSQQIGKVIAESTGAEIITFYSCQNISRADFDRGETYLSLMEKNVDALRKGLA